MTETPRCEHGTPLRARCPICTEERWAASRGVEPWTGRRYDLDGAFEILRRANEEEAR